MHMTPRHTITRETFQRASRVIQVLIILVQKQRAALSFLSRDRGHEDEDLMDCLSPGTYHSCPETKNSAIILIFSCPETEDLIDCLSLFILVLIILVQSYTSTYYSCPETTSSPISFLPRVSSTIIQHNHSFPF
jgi:hypothetical protein